MEASIDSDHLLNSQYGNCWNDWAFGPLQKCFVEKYFVTHKKILNWVEGLYSTKASYSELIKCGCSANTIFLHKCVSNYTTLVRKKKHFFTIFLHLLG